MGICFQAATEAVKENYAEVWDDCSKLKLVAALFISEGTQHVLEGNIVVARHYASFACYLEEYTAIILRSEQKPHLIRQKVLS